MTPRLWLVCLLSMAAAAPAAGQPFTPEHALSLRELSDPRLSPDGKWVAYVVSWLDLEKDENRSDVYHVPYEGGEPLPLTTSPARERRPRWSPDGRFLAFLSDRDGGKNQVWIFDRRGGEPRRVSSLPAGVSDFAWAPDGNRLVLASLDPDANEADSEEEEERTPPPRVITRLQFKRDGDGYLDERRTHLYVLDLPSGDVRQITSGPYDDSEPSWSPDGREIAFVSNRTEEPDANDDTDIFLVSAEGGEPRRLTTNPGADAQPSWSPDGSRIAYVTVVEPELIWYATQHLAVVDRAGGEAKVLTFSLDRNVRSPRFASDGASVFFLLEDSGNQHLARVQATGGPIERVVSGEREIRAFDLGASESAALLVSEPHLPPEIFVRRDGENGLEGLSAAHRDVLDGVRLGEVENVHFRSRDGTEIEGFITKPPDWQEGRRYPAVLWIHGGPVSQFSTAFQMFWQLFAGAGYVVVAVNPRGSSGYGQEFSKAIWADWGNLDYEDVMAGVDDAIERGYADPEQLGVGGWSYGGILTNYVITKTSRFKAAISGASETNYLACYGTDHYQHEWEAELGLPWENRELYLRLSPLSSVARIVTPTLILCGEEDWNVPLNQSEQLYQSLRRLGRETMLVIYPGESHSIRKPSYQKDRYERYLSWFGRFLQKN